MTLQIRPLHEHFGAQVLGFDFSQAMTPERAREILDLADRHFLLLFRGQTVSEDQQVAFSTALGPLVPPVERKFASPTNPMLLRLGNVDAQGNMLPPTDAFTKYNDAAEPWHTDGSFKALPIHLTMLHGLEIPPERGDTGYASTVAAYEALPQDIKDLIADKRMTHPYPNQTVKVGDWQGTQVDLVSHPMVRTLPDGRKALYLANPFSKAQIIGMAPEESDKLFKYLVDFVTSGPFTYIHHWQLGDTLLWNNRGVVHSARGWDRAKYRRLLQRSEISETAAPH